MSENRTLYNSQFLKIDNRLSFLFLIFFFLSMSNRVVKKIIESL